MDQIALEVTNLIEKILREKQVKGENRTVLVDGKNMDLVDEINILKHVVTRVADEYPNRQEISTLQDKISELESRLIAEENKTAGVDLTARTAANKNTKRIQDLNLRYVTERLMERFDFVDGFADSFSDDSSIDYTSSFGIIHDTDLDAMVAAPPIDTATYFQKQNYSNFFFENIGIDMYRQCYDFSYCYEPNGSLWLIGGTRRDNSYAPPRNTMYRINVRTVSGLKYSVSKKTTVGMIPAADLGNPLLVFIESTNTILLATNGRFLRHDVSTNTNQEFSLTSTLDFTGISSSNSKIVYDSDRDRIILTTVGFTAEINPTDWTAVQIGEGYPHPDMFAMVYHKKDKKIYTFGGGVGTSASNATYRFNPQLGIWEQLSLQVSPSSRKYGIHFYDEQYGFMLFGGYLGSRSTGRLYDLWYFNNNKWTKFEMKESIAVTSSEMRPGGILLIDRSVGFRLHYGYPEWTPSTFYSFELTSVNYTNRNITLTPETIESANSGSIYVDYEGEIETKYSTDGLTFTTVLPDQVFNLDTSTGPVNITIQIRLLTEETVVHGVSFAWN